MDKLIRKVDNLYVQI